MKIFIEVIKAGSMSKVSSQLHITQPTITKKIKRLEDDLQVQLFHRSSKGLFLTEVGEIFFKYASEAVSLINEGIYESQKEAKQLQLKIAIPASYSDSVIQKIMPYLEKETILANFFYAHTREIITMVSEGTIDLGIVIDPPVNSNLVKEFLSEDKIVLVCNSNHPFAHFKKVSIEDIVDEKIALFSWGKGYETLLSYLKSKTYKNFSKVTPLSAVKRLILNNNYISFLPESTIRTDIDYERFSICTTDALPSWSSKLSILHKSEPLTEEVKIVTNIIKEIDWS